MGVFNHVWSQLYANESVHLFVHFLFRIPDVVSFVLQTLCVSMLKAAGCKNPNNFALSHSRLQVIVTWKKLFVLLMIILRHLTGFLFDWIRLIILIREAKNRKIIFGRKKEIKDTFLQMFKKFSETLSTEMARKLLFKAPCYQRVALLAYIWNNCWELPTNRIKRINLVRGAPKTG